MAGALFALAAPARSANGQQERMRRLGVLGPRELLRADRVIQ